MTQFAKTFCKVAFALAFLILDSDLISADWKTTVSPRQIEVLQKVKKWSPTFYIATDGNDDWSGKLAEPNADKTDGPFRTFEKAKLAVRDYRNSATFDGKVIVVEVRAGVYELNQTVTFDRSDSGNAESPVVWRGEMSSDFIDHPEKKTDSDVILCGGRFLKDPKPVTDPVALERIKPEVRDKIVQFDLRAHGIDDFGTLDGKNNAELFFNHQPMTLARYPNEGFITIDRLVTEGTTEVDIRGTKGIAEPKFYFDGDYSKWDAEPDAWTLGYWFWDWANSRQKITKIDHEKKILELEPPYHSYGYRIGQYYYAYNLLCELDAPGEFYIDHQTGILYFYPPKTVEGNELFLSNLTENVRATDVSHFVFCGFLLDGCRGDALTLSGQEALICDCAVRNIGGGGINVTGPGNLVFGNHLYNLGSYGISAMAGDRVTLTPGKLAVVNNDIHDYGRVLRVYAPGVSVSGCGNIVASNRITDAPHNAIFFAGNEQVIELNEIGHVCYESNDAGAIYAGRDWTQRGNVIRNNYLHDITGFQDKGCVGVYLDDMFSSADIVGNLFVNVTRAAFIGGGRDNSIVNNIFVNCNPAIHVDARALGWCAYHADGWLDEEKTKGTLSGISYKVAPYADAYPKLKAIMEGTPKAPEGNLIAQNVVINNAWNRRQPDEFLGDAIESQARPYLTITNNIVGDYRLLLSLKIYPSPTLPNPKVYFERIPTERIGRFDHPAATARP